MMRLDRREFLKVSGSVLIGLTMGGVTLHAQAQQRVELNDKTARALKYTHKSTVSGQNCANCVYIQANSGAWRPCTIFPGKLVNASGWCSAWVKKG